MENNEDTVVVRPTLKLSRCSRKPRKRIGTQNSDLTEKKPPAKRKKQSWKSMDDIPIPSFSPVHDLNKLDFTVLDSPVKKEAKKEEEKDVFEFHGSESDDGDDELLNGPPTFAASQHKRTTKKGLPKEEKATLNQSCVARKVSSESEATVDKEFDADDERLSDETLQTIETLIQQLEDPSKMTLKKMVNRVVKELDCTVDKQMRRLIREHVRFVMDSEESTNDRSADDPAVQEPAVQKQSSDNAEPVTSTQANSSTTVKKQNTIQPDEDDLIVSIDHWYGCVNAKEATVQEFYDILEAQYDARLHKKSKAIVKARLGGLSKGEIELTVTPERVTESTDSQDTEALRVEAAAVGTGNADRDEQNIEGDDGDDVVMLMDDSDEPSCINAMVENATSAKDTGKKGGDDEAGKRSAPPPPPKDTTTTKPPAKKRGRPPKKAKSVEAIDGGEDESGSSTKQSTATDRSAGAVEKPVPKRKKAAPRKPRAPRAKKGTCALCTTCTCTLGKETSVSDTPAPNMSRTDAQIERALLARTKKLEGIIDRYQGMLDHVNRELKKHRRAVWKKEEAQLNDGRQLAFGDSRFLPDADVWDEQAEAATYLDALSPTIVQEAQETVFGTGNCQITLTQLFGGGSKEKGEKGNENADQSDGVKEDNAAVLDETCSQTATDEDMEEEAADAVEFEPEPEPVDHIHRLTWRKGNKVDGQSPLQRGSGAWSALTTNAPKGSLADPKPFSPQATGTLSPTQATDNNFILPPPSRTDQYNCAWDDLFSDGLSQDEEGLDQLLDLFDTELSDDYDGGNDVESNEFAQQSTFDTVILSQRGESLVNAIEEEITSDPLRLQSIEAVCPKWRDNLRYALAHREPTEIRQALERVRRSMTNLERTQEVVSTVWKRQRIVLELFESSLSASLSRLSSQGESTSEGDTPSIAKQKESTTLSPIMEGDEEVMQPSQ